ncbi:prokineticin-1 isoform X2 [Anarhichas minor]|uniref:prokineticin-1 isoform X2 n=1 Tax=Anarhichas minor TaxID=65739 RepID=UPI003F7350AB
MHLPLNKTKKKNKNKAKKNSTAQQLNKNDMSAMSKTPKQKTEDMGHLIKQNNACERDVQCGFGLCCAVSLWLRGLRMCAPRGVEGDECHPFSHKVPYPGKRQHHTCPCLPHLMCTRYSESKYRCTDDFKSLDF